MNEKVLIVDDDANLLQGLRRQLRKKFDLTFADGGLAAKELLDSGKEFAVIVSDMQMPEFNGLQLLCYVREKCNDTSRIMLTGNADQQTATDAVNDGAIFRFINKPCETADLEQAINDALDHHRLVCAEKDVLEQTLKGSIELMSDVMALLNPSAFGRANRNRSIVKSICAELGIRNSWQIEVATTFAQVGRATVPNDVLERSYRDEELPEDMADMLQEHPVVSAQLVSRIPRLELVGEIISRQAQSKEDSTSQSSDPVQVAAELLEMVLTYDALSRTRSPFEAVAEVEKIERFNNRSGWVAALRKSVAENFELTAVHFEELVVGMVLDEDIFDEKEVLVVTKGQEVTNSLIARLLNFKKAKRKITEPIRVRYEVQQSAPSMV